MTSLHRTIITLAGLTAIALFSGCADEKPLQLTDQPCTVPPVLHCPDENCSADVTNDTGPVVEPKTGRHYFLDYPCNLKKGEKVTVVLSIHGAGGHGNWHRHYFPMLDYVDKYRLVVATPNTPRPLWTPEDDDYLQNIVSSIIDRIGKKNIKALWLVGHSQGGMTSNRIVCSDFFKDKVDGWLSLSGGRIGPVTLPAAFKVPDSGEDGMPPALREISKLTGGARPGAASPPSCDISYHLHDRRERDHRPARHLALGRQISLRPTGPGRGHRRYQARLRIQRRLPRRAEPGHGRPAPTRNSRGL